MRLAARDVTLCALKKREVLSSLDLGRLMLGVAVVDGINTSGNELS